jgi:hypothetical protein
MSNGPIVLKCLLCELPIGATFANGCECTPEMRRRTTDVLIEASREVGEFEEDD